MEPTQTAPQTAPSTTSSPQASSLDPQAVALTQAIRQTESGGNFQAKGASGEYGAYQWEPGTWAKMSQEAGVNVPLEQATPEQQNQVAYTQIKQWKDAGYNVGQIASMWNAGEGAPNAYLNDNVGVNAKGVSYNTPEYAKKVATFYQEYKNNPSSVSQNQPEPTSIKDVANGVLNFAAPIIPDLYHDITGANNKTISQQAADLGITGLDAAMFIPGLQPEDLAAQAGLRGAEGGASLLGSVVGNAGAGAALGGLGAVSQGNTSAGAIGSGALTGGLLGGTAGAVAPTLGKWLDNIPTSLAKGVFKGADSDVADYAVNNKPLGTVSSMLDNSKKVINEAGSNVKGILTSPQYAENIGQGTKALDDTLAKYATQSDSLKEGGIGAIADELKSVVPLKDGLINKLVNGTATLNDKNILRQAIDLANYGKFSGELPKLTASKTIANDVANNLRREVQSAAPETVPYFDQLSKEIPLGKILSKMDKRSGAQLGLFDVLSALGGYASGGAPGAVAADIGTRVARSPVARLGAAKAINTVSPLLKLAGTAGKVGLLRGVAGTAPQ